MSDEVKSFINNVQNNNNVDAGQDFKDAIRAKVGDALETRRKELVESKACAINMQKLASIRFDCPLTTQIVRFL